MTRRTYHHTTREHPDDRAFPLLAGFDSINYCSQARISSAMRAKLEELILHYFHGAWDIQVS